jgi:CO/xanthine dehydrogenase Mo-binding subunit
VEKLKAAVARWSGCEPGAVEFRDGAFVPADGARVSLLEAASRSLSETGALRGEAAYTPDPGLQWDEQAYRGSAYKAYSWGADVVEVEVDPCTMEVKVLSATAVAEIGRAIHPVMAIGQIEGGTLQALGFGSMEEMKTRGGAFVNDRMATYIIPTALDAPDFQVEIAELPTRHGPFGAKGLGELPFDGGAPALAAAIEDAVGFPATELPITPEKLLRWEGQGR